MRVNIWIPDKLLKELDEFLDGRSRSAFISDLISSRIQSKPAKTNKWAEPDKISEHFNPVPKPKKK